MSIGYWDDFYSGSRSAKVPTDPSTFAESVLPLMTSGGRVLEVGFGTARDSLFFAQKGLRVIGVDFSHAAVQHASELARHRGLDATFKRLDLSDAVAVTGLAAAIKQSNETPHVYGRFLLHAIDDTARANVINLLSSVLDEGNCGFFEFRTGLDQGRTHVFGEHYRRFLDPMQVVTELGAAGLAVTSQEEGFGLATFGSEDPHVCRLVVRARATT